MVGDRPSGTVTFLFTDIEGSTRLWEDQPGEMKAALARHDGIVRSMIEGNGGYVFATGGDGFAAAFATPDQAVAAAKGCQLELLANSDNARLKLRVRIGINTGHANERGGDYFGPEVNRAARVMDAGHGGQILLSSATAALTPVRHRVDLGEHRLRDLSSTERIHQVVASGLESDFPALRTLEHFESNLPQELSSFVGRAAMLSQLEDLISKNRLVTLTGVGGVGKTRLALQLSASLLPQFEDGVWFIALATVGAEAEVLDAIGLAVGLPGSKAVTLDALTETLERRETLLAIDNCEHVIDEVAGITTHILERCPHLHIVATSREGLGVAGELQRTVPSLEASDSVELFLQRCDAVDAGLDQDERSIAAIEELCRRLDGVPLALELAAARTKTMGIADIVDRLDRRFKLLASRQRGSVKRHQTMEATIDWSYDLLAPPEQSALCRCSTFSGGFDLNAGEAVLVDEDIDEPDVLDLLASLVEKSLVVVAREPSGTRYSMLETIREYGFRRLIDSGSADTARSQHAQFFGQRNAETCAGLCSPDERHFQELFDLDLDNLRSAIGWAVSTNDGELAAQLIAPMAKPIFSIRADAVGTARDVIELPNIPQHLLAAVLTVGVYDTYLRYDVPSSVRLAQLALEAGPTSPTVYRIAAIPQVLQTQFQAAIDFTATGIGLSRESGDRFELAHNLVGHSLWLSAIQHDAGEDAAREAVDVAAEVGNPTLVCHANLALSVAIVTKNPTKALDLAEAGAAAGKETGALGLGDCYINAAAACFLLDRPHDMPAFLIQGLQILMEHRATLELGLALLYASLALAAANQDETARRIMAAAEARSPVLIQGSLSQVFYDRLVGLVGPITAERNDTLGLDEAVAVALESLRALDADTSKV